MLAIVGNVRCPVLAIVRIRCACVAAHVVRLVVAITVRTRNVRLAAIVVVRLFALFVCCNMLCNVARAAIIVVGPIVVVRAVVLPIVAVRVVVLRQCC